MASIQIHTLNPAGSDLFADDESYLKELTDSEMEVQGGLATLIIFVTIACIPCCVRAC